MMKFLEIFYVEELDDRFLWAIGVLLTFIAGFMVGSGASMYAAITLAMGR